MIPNTAIAATTPAIHSLVTTISSIIYSVIVFAELGTTANKIRDYPSNYQDRQDKCQAIKEDTPKHTLLLLVLFQLIIKSRLILFGTEITRPALGQ